MSNTRTVFAVAKSAIMDISVKALWPNAREIASANGAVDAASCSCPTRLIADIATKIYIIVAYLAHDKWSFILFSIKLNACAHAMF